MATYQPPKKNVAAIFYVSLVSQANTKTFQGTPTLAAGDFLSYQDGVLNTVASGQLATTPTNTPASSKLVKISLSSGEMNADNVTVVCSDAAGSEWCDLVINIQTSAQQIDDLATPTNITSATGIDVKKINATTVNGTGTAGDLGRG